jgi:response regulator RpfG family c-di-GMP phosphodiesterase
LHAYQRGLRKLFDIETAPGGAEGLEMIASHGPFAVVVSDMRMPGMDGVQFLASVKKQAPQSVRMMLTGNADQGTAMEAVNEGNIFRFLTKPCPPDDLAKALTAGIEQYRLITAEKELLGKTLLGSIRVLNEVLSLANPSAFGHASRVRKLVSQICKEMNVPRSWEYETAATLSQIGCVTVPPDTLERFHEGKTLLQSETEMIQSVPQVGSDLVANIPRLESVSQSIAYQNKCFDGTGVPHDDVAGAAIPLGARILKVALDYDAAKWGGRDDIDAVTQLAGHQERYDPEVFAALRVVVGVLESFEKTEIALKKLVPGMSLAEDVKTIAGLVIVAKGQEVTAALCQRIHNFARHSKVEEPVCVLVRVTEVASAAAAR